MKYSYLLASLPTLQLQQSTGMETATFTKLCQQHLTDNHYTQLLCVAKAYEGHPNVEEQLCSGIAKLCIAYRTSLYAALAAYRTLPEGLERGQLRREIAMRVYISQVFADVQTIVSESNVYQAEVLIMKAIWQYVDQLEASYMYTFENVVVYCVKLILTIRFNNMTQEKGRANFDKAFSTIMEHTTVTW